MYANPSAGPLQTDRLTYDDVIVKTAGLLGVLIVAGAVAWVFMPGLWMVGMGVGLVLGLVNAFKRDPSPPLILAYAVAEGLFLGGISKFYNTFWDGVVIQAVAATLAVFAMVLVLFSSGKIRASGKLARMAMIAMGGYFIFGLINLALVWTGVLPAWGAYSATIGGIPIGLAISLFAILLAAYSFVMDFDAIQTAVRTGAPRRFAWSAAFGLTVTLVWLYLEILRLLAILRSN
jgi:uncharacterized YccA/Bax inhibitor family protein